MEATGGMGRPWWCAEQVGEILVAHGMNEADGPEAQRSCPVGDSVALQVRGQQKQPHRGTTISGLSK